MNLKAIVATLEEKCPNLFDQVRGAWLVAAGGPAANHSPATIGIGFIPVAGAGVAAGRARAGHGAQDGWALQYQMVRQTGGGMSTLATQWHSRSGQTWRVKNHCTLCGHSARAAAAVRIRRLVRGGSSGTQSGSLKCCGTPWADDLMKFFKYLIRRRLFWNTSD